MPLKSSLVLIPLVHSIGIVNKLGLNRELMQIKKI